MAEKVELPYANMKDAVKDHFEKIGGVEKAYKFLRKGYQDSVWRKRWEERAKKRAKEEDEAFAKEQKV